MVCMLFVIILFIFIIDLINSNDNFTTSSGDSCYFPSSYDINVLTKGFYYLLKT